MEYEEFKEKLIESGIDKFRAEYPSNEFGLKLWKTKLYLRQLRKDGVIERKSETGNCTSTCASCYEYGCDAEPRPPYNYWAISKPHRNEEAIKKRAREDDEKMWQNIVY